MKAIRVAKYGGPEELQLQEVAQPEPGAGEALVRVHASGVNYADIYFRNGTLARPIPFPFTLGIEGAGEIEAVGEGVSELKRGDRVAYKWSLGSYAEHDVVHRAIPALSQRYCESLIPCRRSAFSPTMQSIK